MNTDIRELEVLARMEEDGPSYTYASNDNAAVIGGPFDGGGDSASIIPLCDIVERLKPEYEALITNGSVINMSARPFNAANCLLLGAHDEVSAAAIWKKYKDAIDGMLRIALTQKTLTVLIVGINAPRLSEQVKARLKVEHELSRAIQEDQFVIHYQPRVDAKSGKLVGMEALLRWKHPERGLMPPNEFIPLAEGTGMIVALGSLVMNKVCTQLSSWRIQQIPIVPVSVNVSAHQFNEGGVEQLVALCLGEHGIPPEMLEIELTESALMGDFEFAKNEISAIKARGVKVHVDDFGAGYSTLSLLQKLKMDVLKVDRAFTSELGQGKEAEIFFRAIVSMAKALGMTVVAEGGETDEQVRILKSLHCDEIQGNFVSRPLPAEDVPPLLLKRFLLPHHGESDGCMGD